MADQAYFQNLIDKLKGVMPTGDTSNNALNPSAPPEHFLGQLLNKSGLGDEKQSDPDAIQPMQSPIDYAAGGLGAKMGEAVAPAIERVAGNEIGSIGNLKPASYESPTLGNSLHDEANDAVSRITKEGLNKSPTEAALTDMSDNVIPMNQESKEALPLDMSQDARMQRAKDMGFDTDNTFYHGTGKNIESFDPNKSQTIPGSFFSKDPYTAGGYGSNGNQNIIPIHTKTNNLFDPDKSSDIEKLKDWYSKIPNKQKSKYDTSLDDIIKPHPLYPEKLPIQNEISGWGPSESNLVSDFLKQNGYDGQHVYESGKKNIQILNPQNIRSVNAAFDPAKKASGNILAGLGGAATLASQDDDNQEKFNQLRQLLQRK